MAVRIRMKQMGRTHRHYYRIVAIDAPPAARRQGDRGTGHLRSARRGQGSARQAAARAHQVLEERRGEGVRACEAIFNKFMKKWEEIEAQEAAKAAEEAAKAAGRRSRQA